MFEWRDVYNIPKIDEQHKVLFNILKYLYDSPLHEKNKTPKNHMKALYDYITFHFTEEEKYWQEISLPEDMVKHHQAQHKIFTSTIESLLKDKAFLLPMNILDFLKDWIIDHMLGEDKEYARWSEHNGTK